MVGMSQIKKKLYTGLAIGLGVGVVGIGITLFFTFRTIKSYELGTNKNYNKKYMQDVTVLTKDVIQGETITADMVSTVKVHKKTVPSGAQNASAVVGSVASFNIPANIPITDTMISSELVDGDIREQELNSIVMPSDLVEGELVDIRIMYPNGTDYIVLLAKQVKKITEKTMWIDLSEQERLLLNGAIVDSYLNQGSKLYATKYVDAATQQKGSEDAVTLAKEYLAQQYSQELADLASNLPTSTTTTTDTTAESNPIIDEEATTNENGMTTRTADSGVMAISNDTNIDRILDFIVKYKNFAAIVSKSAVNYQPNEQIIAMMESNPNILDQAKEALSSETRANIENGIKTYKSANTDDYNNVVSGAQQSISTQKSERTSLITSAPVATTSTTTTTAE